MNEYVVGDLAVWPSGSTSLSVFLVQPWLTRTACCPGGARCRGGVSSSRALAWNRRTCRPGNDGQGKFPWPREGGPQAVDTASGRVPRRGTGAGRPVVVVKVLYWGWSEGAVQTRVSPGP